MFQSFGILFKLMSIILNLVIDFNQTVLAIPVGTDNSSSCYQHQSNSNAKQQQMIGNVSKANQNSNPN